MTQQLVYRLISS